MSEYLIPILVFSLISNITIFTIYSRLSSPNVTLSSKLFMTTSNFAALSALLILNIDVYQNITNTKSNQLYIYWKSLYWASFIFGYFIFVILSEKDRFGGSRSTLSLFMNFYKQRLIPLFLIVIVSTGLLFVLIYRNLLSFQNLDILPKALANSWGMLLIVTILGFSMVNVLRTAKRKLSYHNTLQNKFIKLEHASSKLIELQFTLEFKIPFLKKKLEFINDQKLTTKFNGLFACLPPSLQENSHHETNSELIKLSDDDLIEEIESDLLDYILNSQKVRKIVKSLIKTITLNESKEFKLPNNIILPRTNFFAKFYRKFIRKFLVIIFITYGFFVSFLIISGLILNGFAINRSFLKTWLCLLPLPVFMVCFNLYLAYFVYLLIHGIKESRLQGFKGLSFEKQTDTQSLLYFTRNIARMVFPLCFHVIQVLALEETEYQEAMGSLYLVPFFGETFMRLFPILLIIFLLLKFFEVYEKLLKVFGISEECDIKVGSDDVRRGKEIFFDELRIFQTNDIKLVEI